MNTENLDKALLAYGDRIIDEMQNQLFENKSVDTGALGKSINAQIIKNKAGQQEKLRINMLEYGQILETGIKPRGASGQGGSYVGYIPSLQRWIKRKNIPVPSKFKSPEQFAFAIAKNIAKNEHMDKGPNKYRKRPFIMISIENAATNFGNEAIAAGVELDLINDIDKAFIKSGATIT
jgi:hypothetical protein